MFSWVIFTSLTFFLCKIASGVFALKENVAFLNWLVALIMSVRYSTSQVKYIRHLLWCMQQCGCWNGRLTARRVDCGFYKELGWFLCPCWMSGSQTTCTLGQLETWGIIVWGIICWLNFDWFGMAMKDDVQKLGSLIPVCCRSVNRKWRQNSNPIKSRGILMFLSQPLGVSRGAQHQCNWPLGIKGGLELVDCVALSLIGSKQFRKWINPFIYFTSYVHCHLIDVHRWCVVKCAILIDEKWDIEIS